MNNLIPYTYHGVGWDILLKRYPFLNDLKGCQQEPEYHAEGDVWTHTQMVVKAFLGMNEYDCSTDEIQELLFACIFHDIGKPITYLCENGKHCSPKHAVRGSEFLRHFLWKSNSSIPFIQREKLIQLIRLHAWPLRFIEREAPERTVLEASMLTSNKLLGVLAMSDMRGRICQDRVAQQNLIETSRLFLAEAEMYNCLNTPYKFPNAHTKRQYFLGKDINPEYALFDSAKFEVTMMCGLPTTGKDLWLKKNYNNLIISRDEIRWSGKYKDEGQVLQEYQSQMKIALAKKTDFAINATHLRRDIRQGYINLIEDYGGKVKIVFCHGDHAELLKRNTKRNAERSIQKQIPNEAIEKLALRMEPPTAIECHELIFVDSL